MTFCKICTLVSLAMLLAFALLAACSDNEVVRAVYLVGNGLSILAVAFSLALRELTAKSKPVSAQED